MGPSSKFRMAREVDDVGEILLSSGVSPEQEDKMINDFGWKCEFLLNV